MSATKDNMNNKVFDQFVLKIYNTASKKIEIFNEMKKGEVGIYVCGPTVYDKPHIGNARPAVVFDVLYRLLLQQYKVKYVRNITDIDDKIIHAAEQKNLPISDITNKALQDYITDMKALNILDPTDQPKATEYVDKMCLIIKTLLENEYAYISPNDDNTSYDVYFNVKKFENYGLFMNKQESNQESAESTLKDNKPNYDFVLWKGIRSSDVEKAKKYNYAWQTPEYMLENTNQIYYGRPGWHLECTAMSVALLGLKFDIHGGGQDLIFPHHENERAQTCSYAHILQSMVQGEDCAKPLADIVEKSNSGEDCAKPLADIVEKSNSGEDCAKPLADIVEKSNSGEDCANYWLHNGLIAYKQGKMSKSLGNIIYLSDLIEKWSALSIRFFLLQTHYRNILDWSDEAVDLAHTRYTLLIKNLYMKWEDKDMALIKNLDEIKDFIDALCQDLNTWVCIAIIEDYIHKGEVQKACMGLFLLGLYPEMHFDQKYEKMINFKVCEQKFESIHLLRWLQRMELTKEQEDLILERQKARANKDYQKADELRKQLLLQKICLEDTKDQTENRQQGYFWYVR